MLLRVRDVQGLENTLLRLGAIETNVEDFIRSARDWFDARALPNHSLDHETFAHICEFARSSTEPTARKLAIGTLRWFDEDDERSPELIRFASRFALRRMATLTGRAIAWDGALIPPEDQEHAHALFHDALEEASAPDAELVASARSFASLHEGSSDMFGRFSHDLSVLAKVLCDESAESGDRDTARAALDYFVCESDAIPDDLGPVGYLDDAFVARRAVERIYPGRASLGEYLDQFAEGWPNFARLTLEGDGESRSLSEFMLVNLAIMLADLEASGAKTGAVLVTPEAGPLPTLLGWVRGLAEVRKFVVEDSSRVFESGARLRHRDTGAEVIFKAYGRLLHPTGAFEPCLAEEATHFQVDQPTKGRGAGPASRTNPMSDLAALQLSARNTSRLKTGTVSLDGGTLGIGPLESIFNSLVPIEMSSDRPRVIVVAPIAESKDLLQTITIGGKPLVEVLPTERVRLAEDAPVEDPWTTGVGGDALLVVVRTAAEALELVELGERVTTAVVAGVRPGSTDATHLCRIRQADVPVLAVVEERDRESQDTLNGESFSFWSWDDEWLSRLRWVGPPSHGPKDAVSAYERKLRKRTSGSVNAVSLDLPGLNEAHSALRELDRLARGRDDQQLDEVLGLGFEALTRVCRHLGEPGTLDDPCGRFDQHVKAAARWWPEEVVACTTAVSTQLGAAVGELERWNPKRELLLSWLRENRSGWAVARRQTIVEVGTREPLSALHWAEPRQQVEANAPVIVPAWLNAAGMARLLVPPVSDQVTLLLYGPEQEWHAALRQRRESARRRLHPARHAGR